MADETIGEAMRRIDALSALVSEIRSDLRSDRADTYAKFVPASLWQEARQSDRADIEDLYRRIEQDRAWRRAVTGWVAAPVIASILSIIVSLVSGR